MIGYFVVKYHNLMRTFRTDTIHHFAQLASKLRAVKVEEPKKCSSAHFPVVKPALSGIELDFFGPSTLTALSFLTP